MNAAVERTEEAKIRYNSRSDSALIRMLRLRYMA